MLILNNALTEEQRLIKACAAVLGNPDYVCVTGLIMAVKHAIVEHGIDGITTAATDGRSVRYSRTFVSDLTDAELRFLILHETWHCLYQHLTTYAELWKLNAQCANMACDYVINIKLVDFDASTNKPGFIVMPEIGLLNTDYRGWTTPEVFRDLYKKAKQGGQGGKGQGQGAPSSGQGQGMGAGETMDHHDWEGAQSMSDEDKKELSRAVDEAARQGALLAGKTGSGGTRLIDDILASKVDWRDVLREFITTTCTGNDFSTWSRPNRRYWGAGIYLPSGISEKVDELVIAPDMSGSTASMLPQIMGEIAGICDNVKPSAVRVLYWDTAVCADEKYEGDDVQKLTESTKPAGGGGTAVSCVSKYMDEQGIKPQAVIVLTDGYLGSDWGTWTVPVLWCILNNKNATPPHGLAVHIDL
jgi:hypothetical protein